MRHVWFTGGVATAGVAALVTQTSYAHGFGERFDLPIPLNMFLFGAAATVALSFVIIGLFLKPRSRTFAYPRYDLFKSPLGRKLLGNTLMLFLIKAASVLLLVLVVTTALFGMDKPIENFSPTFVWIIWWVGMGYISALLGNVWMLVNPWKIAYEWGHRLLGDGTRGQGTPIWRYPARLDVWPAVAMFAVFAWVENVYSGAALPQQLGLIVIQYSIITWAGMLAFGKNTWLKHGEIFSILFGLFAHFSPTEVRVTNRRLCRSCEMDCDNAEYDCVDCYACFEGAEVSQRELNLRPYAVGLARNQQITSATAVFVVLALATVTFDGLTSTPLWLNIQKASNSVAQVFGNYAVDAITTLGLLLLPLIFLAVYLMFSWGILHLSRESKTVAWIAREFVLSLVPIALAYNMAHFISLMAIQGQLIIPLISDPFGFGWDLFGTGDYRLNIKVINAKFMWYISVGAIVLGHITSVYVAHVISIRKMVSHTVAMRSQYPMLVLMVSYTAISLWIIAQPIVIEG